uniref:Uncharacterized protein n=1 Tax=Rhizophora mucronata TaxID=61149 RepID=A0A2P2R164_RHIMU
MNMQDIWDFKFQHVAAIASLSSSVLLLPLMYAVEFEFNGAVLDDEGVDKTDVGKLKL